VLYSILLDAKRKFRLDRMNGSILEPRLYNELKTAIERGLASGKLITATQISQQAGLFHDRFGPTVLGGLDGEALLGLMHGRQSNEPKCLAYWLEFKDDDEFAGHRFGVGDIVGRYRDSNNVFHGFMLVGFRLACVSSGS
jgi:hypothetical protein